MRKETIKRWRARTWAGALSRAYKANISDVNRVMGLPDSLVFQRDGSGYYIWMRHASTYNWTRWWLRHDTTTQLNGFSECAVYDVKPWKGFSALGTFHSSGTWFANPTGGNTFCGLQHYTVGAGGASYLEVNFTGPGDLYVAHLRGTDRGYFYVTIDGSTTLVNQLPTSGANKYVDGYASANSFTQTLVATNIPSGSHVLRLTRSTTEKNPSSTDYRLFPDSYAVISPGSGLPGLDAATVPVHITRCQTEISGVFQSRTGTLESNWSTMTFPSLAANTDRVYFGASLRNARLTFDFSTVNTGGGTITAEYWNGTAWTALTIVDGTNAFTQDGTISWTVPTNWTTNTVNSVLAFWVRFSFSNTTSTTSTASCTAGAVNPVVRRTLEVAAGSQAEYAYHLNINGVSRDVGGWVHGNELRTSITILIDGVEVSPTDGSYTASTKKIEVRQNMNVLHDQATGGVAGSGWLHHTFKRNSMDVSWRHTFTQSATIDTYKYSGMCPPLWWSGLGFYVFTAGRLVSTHRHAEIPFTSLSGSTPSGLKIANGFLYYSSLSDFFMMVTQPKTISSNRGFHNTASKVFVLNLSFPTMPGGGSSVIVKAYMQTISSGRTQAIQSGYSIGGDTSYLSGEYSNIENVIR